MELTSTSKLDAFFALHAPHAVQASAQVAVADAPINKRIGDIASAIEKSEIERADLIKNAREIRTGINLVLKGNQTLKRLVTARNPDALDVMGVFGEFRIPREVTDLSSEDIAVTTRPRVRDSVYRNTVRDLVSFVVSKGYAVINEGGISTSDISDVISGVLAGRRLKMQGFKTVVSAIKDANYAEERIEELSRSIAELNQEQDKLGAANQDKRTQTVTLVSEINKKQEDVRVAALNAQRLAADIAALTSKAELFRSVGNLTQADLKAKVVELKSSYKDLQTKYGELVTEQKLLRRTSKTTRDQKAFDLQEQSLQRKRAEKINQLTGKYGRLSAEDAKKKIKKEMAAWEKVQRDNIAEINRLKGRSGSANTPVETKNADQLSQQLDQILVQMQGLETKIQVLQHASTLTQTERQGRLGTMSDLMAMKKQELKNQARKVERRESVLQNEIDPELWESRISERLEEEKFLDQARKHHPLHAIFYALDVGMDQKAKRMMDIAWSYFKRGATFKLTRTLKKQLKTPAHFGAKGFIVDPRFPRINAELVTILSTAINEAYKKLKPSDLEELLLPAVLDTITNTPQALSEHKAMYKQTLLLIQKQLVSGKTQTIMHEIIEDLIADGRITTTSGARPTKKFVTEMVDNFIGVIKTAKAVDKLAAFTWASYREDMAAWIRNTFKTTKKKSTLAKKGF